MKDKNDRLLCSICISILNYSQFQVMINIDWDRAGKFTAIVQSNCTWLLPVYSKPVIIWKLEKLRKLHQVWFWEMFHNVNLELNSNYYDYLYYLKLYNIWGDLRCCTSESQGSKVHLIFNYNLHNKLLTARSSDNIINKWIWKSEQCCSLQDEEFLV